MLAMNKKMKRIIITAFLLCSRVLAGDDYLFVDKASGKTNGPIEILPYTDIVLEGKTYTLKPTIVPLEMESKNVPAVDFRNTPVCKAVNTALLTCGLTNSPPKVVFLQQDKITERVTFSAKDITLGVLFKLICETCNLTLVRDRSSQTLVFIPNAMASERTTAKVFNMAASTYDQTIKPYGSFNRLLVEVGVIRREMDMFCEFQRDLSVLVLYGSPEALHKFENTFTILDLQGKDGQPTNSPYSSPAAGLKR